MSDTLETGGMEPGGSHSVVEAIVGLYNEEVAKLNTQADRVRRRSVALGGSAIYSPDHMLDVGEVRGKREVLGALGAALMRATGKDPDEWLTSMPENED